MSSRPCSPPPSAASASPSPAPLPTRKPPCSGLLRRAFRTWPSHEARAPSWSWTAAAASKSKSHQSTPATPPAPATSSTAPSVTSSQVQTSSNPLCAVPPPSPPNPARPWASLAGPMNKAEIECKSSEPDRRTTRAQAQQTASSELVHVAFSHRPHREDRYRSSPGSCRCPRRRLVRRHGGNGIQRVRRVVVYIADRGFRATLSFRGLVQVLVAKH